MTKRRVWREALDDRTRTRQIARFAPCAGETVHHFSLLHLASLIAVDEHGTVTAAARRLAFSQSTVTLHLQHLERQVGQPLFTRPPRRQLTPVGKLLLATARQLLTVEGDFLIACSVAEDTRRGSACADETLRDPRPLPTPRQTAVRNSASAGASN